MAIEIVTVNDARFDQLCRDRTLVFLRKNDQASVVALCESNDDVAEALQRFRS